jgi:hypothetical protein
MRQALVLIKKNLLGIVQELAKFAETHKALPTLGYTHFQAAQPTTVGKRATLWIQSLLLDLEDLDYKLDNLRLRGAKGTTGTAESFKKLFQGDFETYKKLDQKIAQKLGFENLFAVTGQTAAELITQRANAQLPTMGLTNWKGSVVRKGDIAISKNYLAEEELKRLNLLVSAFLENAQLRAENRKSTTMQEWQTYVDKVLALNELTILKNAGRVSHEQMLEQVTQCFDAFETNRQEQAKQRAELAYEKTLEAELTRLIDKRKQSLKSKQTRKKPNHLG